jgi:lipopolysaccharide export system permease protein
MRWRQTPIPRELGETTGSALASAAGGLPETSALNLTRDGAEFQTVKILNKYALQEHVGPLCFALGALTSLLLLNYIAKNIGNLVGKGLPWSVIVEFIGLSVPFTVAMTMPMAVLVSVLYAFSRLAAENEITALKASGVALSRLLTPVLLGASLISLSMIWFNDQVLPRSNHQLRSLMEDIARKKPTFALHAQVINAVSPGKLYLRAGHLDEATDKMREVVIYDLGDPGRRRTIYADSGTMALTPSGDLALTLFDGLMEEVQKTNPGELQRLYYKENHIRVHGVGNTLTRSTNDTYKSEREMGICEMQDVVAGAQRDEAGTAAEIDHSLVNAVRIAATGISTPTALPFEHAGGWAARIAISPRRCFTRAPRTPRTRRRQQPEARPPSRPPSRRRRPHRGRLTMPRPRPQTTWQRFLRPRRRRSVRSTSRAHSQAPHRRRVCPTV